MVDFPASHLSFGGRKFIQAQEEIPPGGVDEFPFESFWAKINGLGVPSKAPFKVSVVCFQFSFQNL